jgi:hypothetical protein
VFGTYLGHLGIYSLQKKAAGALQSSNTGAELKKKRSHYEGPMYFRDYIVTAVYYILHL